MKSETYDQTCGICRSNGLDDALFENRLWVIRRLPAGLGVPGWLMLNSRRHVPGIAHFDDEEAANFGPALRHFERVLEEVTGALRIYTAAMGESFPHFHAHLVPRYAEMPNDAKAWAVFDLYRATQVQEVPVDEAEVERVAQAYRQALRRSPPPS
jgi:diadenosine tetraphosphate (Ap4A) HIT family hydrolase